MHLHIQIRHADFIHMLIQLTNQDCWLARKVHERGNEMIAGPFSEDSKDPKMLQFSLLTTKQEGWQLAKKTLCGSVHPSACTDGEN